MRQLHVAMDDLLDAMEERSDSVVPYFNQSTGEVDVWVDPDVHDGPQLDPDDPDSRENPSVRAVRWAWGLPGIERVRVVHAWFLPSLAIGVHAEIAAQTDEMDAAAQARIDRVLAAAGPPP